jgi:hypothetical protein
MLVARMALRTPGGAGSNTCSRRTADVRSEARRRSRVRDGARAALGGNDRCRGCPARVAGPRLHLLLGRQRGVDGQHQQLHRRAASAPPGLLLRARAALGGRRRGVRVVTGLRSGSRAPGCERQRRQSVLRGRAWADGCGGGLVLSRSGVAGLMKMEHKHSPLQARAPQHTAQHSTAGGARGCMGRSPTCNSLAAESISSCQGEARGGRGGRGHGGEHRQLLQASQFQGVGRDPRHTPHTLIGFSTIPGRPQTSTNTSTNTFTHPQTPTNIRATCPVRKTRMSPGPSSPWICRGGSTGLGRQP